MVDQTPPDTPPASGRPYDALGEAKRLLRTVRAGALATVGQEGHPFASLVSVATLPDGSPLLLLSRLAGHTGHLEADPRCSLLLAQGGKGDPLAHPRLTVTGRAARLDNREPAAARFLLRHPKAALYAGFPDFAFWRVDATAFNLNGGFARAARFAGTEVLTSLDGRDTLVAAETEAIVHLNGEHRDAVRLYATVLARAGDGDWTVSGIDPDGLDLLCGDRTARVIFGERIATPEQLRRVLAEMAAKARMATLAS